MGIHHTLIAIAITIYYGNGVVFVKKLLIWCMELVYNQYYSFSFIDYNIIIDIIEFKCWSWSFDLHDWLLILLVLIER